MTKLPPCPCKGCQDRSANCHKKGNCPHGYEDWQKEHEEERDRINREKEKRLPSWTAAQERRHFNWVKFGQGNSKKQ